MVAKQAFLFFENGKHMSSEKYFFLVFYFDLILPELPQSLNPVSGCQKKEVAARTQKINPTSEKMPGGFVCKSCQRVIN